MACVNFGIDLGGDELEAQPVDLDPGLILDVIFVRNSSFLTGRFGGPGVAELSELLGLCSPC